MSADKLRGWSGRASLGVNQVGKRPIRFGPASVYEYLIPANRMVHVRPLRPFSSPVLTMTKEFKPVLREFSEQRVQLKK